MSPLDVFGCNIYFINYSRFFDCFKAKTELSLNIALSTSLLGWSFLSSVGSNRIYQEALAKETRTGD